MSEDDDKATRSPGFMTSAQRDAKDFTLWVMTYGGISNGDEINKRLHAMLLRRDDVITAARDLHDFLHKFVSEQGPISIKAEGDFFAEQVKAKLQRLHLSLKEGKPLADVEREWQEPIGAKVYKPDEVMKGLVWLADNNERLSEEPLRRALSAYGRMLS